MKGRYDEKELNETYIGNTRRYDLIYKYYMKYSSRRALGFCCSRLHAEAMAEEFCKRGIPAVAVYSNADGLYRKQVGEVSSDGEYRKKDGEVSPEDTSDKQNSDTQQSLESPGNTQIPESYHDSRWTCSMKGWIFRRWTWSYFCALQNHRLYSCNS